MSSYPGGRSVCFYQLQCGCCRVMWSAESFYHLEWFLSSHRVLFSVLSSTFFPYIDCAVVLLCVPAELYNICLARAKEKFKILLHMYIALNGPGPKYISDMNLPDPSGLPMLVCLLFSLLKQSMENHTFDFMLLMPGMNFRSIWGLSAILSQVLKHSCSPGFFF